MSMNVPQDSGGQEDPIADINVTPLVDVMLVLLIVFLITVPVALAMKPHELPKITNIETTSKPENIVLVITENGDYYDGTRKLESATLLKEYIKSRAIQANNAHLPPPEVHVRADRNVRFEFVGRAIFAIQQGGLIKVGFLTEPPPRS